jgi:hypothetical protein
VKLDQIRWDSVAKIAAGALLAIAIATTAPSLLGSDDPEPLDPDVGLPQAAIPPPPPAPPPAPPVKPPKRKPRPEKHPRKRRHKPKKPLDDEPSPSSAPAAVLPSGLAEDFGFERP